jgi:adenylate cyclase
VRAGGADILLVRQGGEIYALRRNCPHMALSLEGGLISDGCIVCPHHHSAFELKSGRVRDWTPWPPGIGRVLGVLNRYKPLPTFPVRVRDGAISVSVEAGGLPHARGKFVRIEYESGEAVEVEEGTSVLEASIRLGIDHMHACGGEARCTTCRVEVLAGIEHCPQQDDDERQVTAMNGIASPMRLACQLRPTGDLRVRVLVHEGDLRSARLSETSARELNVAVLFADIRNFTAFSERRLPFDVLHVLNRYFDCVGAIVEVHGGGVISFQGDGMMCLFGLAGEGDRAARSAVEAALRMQEATAAQATYCAEHFDLELRVGIGIDFGRAVVGEVGYYRSAQLNAIGDVVNTAARVQALTKETGTSLLITRDVVDRLRGRFALGREFELEIRGKAGLHRLYEVTGGA